MSVAYAGVDCSDDWKPASPSTNGFADQLGSEARVWSYTDLMNDSVAPERTSSGSG